MLTRRFFSRIPNMKVVLDPTDSENTFLEVDSRVLKFSHKNKDAGAGIIRALDKLNLAKEDELCVVTGPGNFSAVRTAALIANAVAYLTSCQLLAKNKTEKTFRSVKVIQPFYASEPSITMAKK